MSIFPLAAWRWGNQHLQSLSNVHMVYKGSPSCNTLCCSVFNFMQFIMLDGMTSLQKKKIVAFNQIIISTRGEKLHIMTFNHNIWPSTDVSSSSNILSWTNSHRANITLMHFSYSSDLIWLRPEHAWVTNDWSLIILQSLQPQKYSVKTRHLI